MARYPQGLLVSCQIPWNEKDQLLEPVFREVIRMALQDFQHLYIFGTAGEGYAVDLSRFREVVGIFAEETLRKPDIHPMVGVIGLSTATFIERLAIAHEAGFRVFQISLPSWGALNDVELMTFFKDVCGAFPDSQFLHYNLARAKRMLEAPDYRKIVDVIPNLVATKNMSGGLPRASALVSQVPELQHFMSEFTFPHGIMYGECSLLAAFGPMTPHKAKELFDAGRRRDVATLFALQKRFHDLLQGMLGPLLKEDRMDGAYDKILTRLGGLDAMPLRLLSPYQGFTEAQYQTARKILQERFPEFVDSRVAATHE
jgi:dihydrodipicolinate synthase/N-acetylneuraminate lyase